MKMAELLSVKLYPFTLNYRNARDVQKLIINTDFDHCRAKIKNIEETEGAKQKLIIERMTKKEAISEFVPTNMAVNFVQHNRCEYCCHACD